MVKLPRSFTIKHMAETAALLQDIHPEANAVFHAAGMEVVRFPKSIATADLIDMAHEVEVLGIRSGPELPKEVFEHNQSLQAVGCFCVGFGHVKTGEAAHSGIPVFNSAFENTRAVAEYVVGSTFSLLRRLHEHNTYLHEGTWTKTDSKSFELLGKTVGIIGYGATGSQAASMLEMLGMSVIFYDPAPKFPKQSRAERVESMKELLGRADVVSLHVPGGQTIITAEAIGQMKPGSYLINTSRGEAIDDQAVAEALDSGHLAGFAGDVFQGEPASRGAVFEHPLQGQRNALLTPHIAGSSQEAQRNIGVETAKRLVGYVATGTTMGAVNVGEVGLGPVAPGTSRVMQFHHNSPGAAQAVDGVFGNLGFNIERQRLETKNGVGYVVSDVKPEITAEALNVIEALDQTIRVRAI